MEPLNEQQTRALREMSTTLGNADDPDLIEDFLYSILTPNEQATIAARWELVKLIDQGVSQRKISDMLGLSLCKITRGSKELKKENSAFARMIHLFRQVEARGIT
ncbi:MAG: transcriptional regulator [Spirochaetales bacterium]|jgi:TrpR family transcriptional regulator, trp operon repressor|nr:transcriptional regulator [Spirochaetales bacterium]